MVKCSIKCCMRNAQADIGISFFRFPAERSRCDEWLVALGRADLLGVDAEKMHSSKFRICSVHFHTNSFSSMLMNRLKKEAVPILFPSEAAPGPFFWDDSNLIANFSKNSLAPDEQSEVDTGESKSEGAKVKENTQTEEKMECEESNETGKETIESEKVAEKPVEENGLPDESKDVKEINGKASTEENQPETRAESGILSSMLNAQNDENEDDDDDFNPLLLCPDISMDVEESPVVTTGNDNDLGPISSSNDPMDSNSLFAPLFSTFVDEMTGAEISFNLTAEEQQLREKLYGPNNLIEYSKVHCTACNVHLGSALAGQTNRFVHPLLKVLICKECYHFYTSGEFEKDEDGSELYCRWCGQGGQVLCCSKCEFVFCKKCIRINFGRKKLTEVRDSDEWKCFRCDMSQLKTLRAMCVEFFEYVRKETARASTLNDPDFINRDLTNCCQAQIKKRMAEAEPEAEKEKEPVKRAKRTRKNEEDPDYNPFTAKDAEEKVDDPVPSTSGVKVVGSCQPPPLLPKPLPNEVLVSGSIPSPTIRIGNTVLNVKSGTPTTTPIVMRTPPSLVSRTGNTAVRTPTPVVSRARQTPTPRSSGQCTPRTPVQITPKTPCQAVTPRTPVSSPAVPSVSQVRPTAVRISNASHTMKHEWFEKTVRAAARVNSNLSYTLTQLNKAQASASSVEQLAVVHNKLQEILSSSINSLIQIRKNLRTEFIAGIKTIRFPPKQPVDPNDDDVIIVNPTPAANKSNKIFAGLPQISVKRNLKPAPTTPVNNTTPTTPASSSNAPARGYLKVKSFSQLQTLTAECITIPDDDPPVAVEKDDEPVIVGENIMPEMEKDPLADDPVPESDQNKIDGPTGTIEIIENPSNKEVEEVVISAKEKEGTKENESEKKNGDDKAINEKNEDDKAINEKSENDKEMNSEKENTNVTEKEVDTNNKETEVENKKDEQVDKNKNEEVVENCVNKDDENTNESNGDAGSNCSEKLTNGTSDGEIKVKEEPTENNSYNVKEKPSPKIRRMLSVKVNLKKTPVIEDMVKQEPIENGGE